MAMFLQIAGWIVPYLIPLFFKDLEVRKNKLAQFEAWQKNATSKGAAIADAVSTTQELEEELKNKRQP